MPVRRRSKHKNLKTSTAILIGVGVLVGVPILLFGAVAYAAGKAIKNFDLQPEMLPLSGSRDGMRWRIEGNMDTSYSWSVWSEDGQLAASGESADINQAKRDVLVVLKGLQR